MRILFVSVLGIAVVAGVGFYLLSSNDSEENVTEDSASAGDVAADDVQAGEAEVLDSGSGTLMSLVSLGQSMACDFRYQEPETEARTEGTVYIAGEERMRGDFTMTGTEDGTMDMSVIRDGDMSYLWGDSPMGRVAFRYETIEPDPAGDPEHEVAENDPFASDDEVEYECRKWPEDASVFTPPNDIEFSDLQSQMMDLGGMDGMPEGIDCSACDQVPEGAARAQCLAALGCS